MTSRLSHQEHKERSRKRREALSTFQQVLKNGFYPKGFTKSSSRTWKRQRNRTSRNHRLYDYFPSRRLQHQKHMININSDRSRRKYLTKHRRRNRRKHVLSGFRKPRKCKRPPLNHRKNIVRLKYYRNEKCDHNFRMSHENSIVPILLNTKRTYADLRDVYARKALRTQPKFSPLILNSERRIGYGSHGGHPGVNSIYVGKDESGILWPLLGIFGLFQLLTTGAIGKSIKYNRKEDPFRPF